MSTEKIGIESIFADATGVGAGIEGGTCDTCDSCEAGCDKGCDQGCDQACDHACDQACDYGDGQDRSR